MTKKIFKKAPAKKAAPKPTGPKYLVREQKLLNQLSYDENSKPRIAIQKRIYADGMSLIGLITELEAAMPDFGEQGNIELEPDSYWCFGHDDGYCYCGPPSVELVLHGYRQLNPKEEKIWNDIQIKKEKYERSNNRV